MDMHRYILISVYICIYSWVVDIMKHKHLEKKDHRKDEISSYLFKLRILKRSLNLY